MFLQKFSPYRPFITFSMHRDLKAYLKSLRLIGVPEDMLHLVILISGDKEELPSDRASELAGRYGLPVSQVHAEARGSGKKKGTLGVKVGRAHDSKQFTLSKGFRCFVYCCAIYMHILA